MWSAGGGQSAIHKRSPIRDRHAGTGQHDQLRCLGRIKTTIAPDGATTQYVYAGIDVTVTDAAGRATTYKYSAAGSPGRARLVSVTDAANVVTSYTYDVLDALVKLSGPSPIPDGTWTYNATGLLLSDTQPESGTTTTRPAT